MHLLKRCIYPRVCGCIASVSAIVIATVAVIVYVKYVYMYTVYDTCVCVCVCVCVCQCVSVCVCVCVCAILYMGSVACSLTRKDRPACWRCASRAGKIIVIIIVIIVAITIVIIMILIIIIVLITIALGCPTAMLGNHVGRNYVGARGWSQKCTSQGVGGQGAVLKHRNS